jgi:hypothetical protein
MESVGVLWERRRRDLGVVKDEAGRDVARAMEGWKVLASGTMVVLRY